VEGFKSFFDRSFRIEAVNLIEVDEVGLEALETLIQFKKNGFAGEAAAVGLLAHEALDFGGEDDGFAAGVGFEEAAENGLAVAAGVDVGGIEEIDAQIESLAEKGLAVGFIESPGLAAGQKFAGGWRTIGHAAETDAGDFESGVAEIDVIHGLLLGTSLERRGARRGSAWVGHGAGLCFRLAIARGLRRSNVWRVAGV
jgi:hypothetical protein